MMKRKTRKPLYLLVEDRLRNDITSGVFREGDLIPREQDLAKRYGVSQGTLRRAALSLKGKGLIHRVQKKGTFVVFQESNTRRLRHYRFTEQVRSKPEFVNATAAFLNLNVIRADEETAGYLGIRKGAKIIRLERLGKIAEPHLFHTISFFPKHLYEGLERYTAEQFVKNTIWKIQETYFGLSIAMREEFISAVPASQQLARMLEVSHGSPVLRINAIVTGSDGDIVEYRVSHCAPGNQKFYVCQEW